MRAIAKILGCFPAAIVSMAIHAQGADNYPSRPVTVVLPTTPGTVVDVEGRIWTDKLAEVLGQPVVRENKPGASTYLGLAYLARANPDGHTLGLGTISMALAPLKPEPLFDP